MNQSISARTDIRRLGYFIAQRDGTMDFLMHSIAASAEVLDELQKIISVIFNLQPIIFAFKVVKKNYSEIEIYRSRLNNFATANMVPISVAMDETILTVQKVSNFLSSASAFLKQTERHLRQMHGTTSIELNTWNKKRKDLHSTNFSYRFLYELRNYTQHRNLPLSNFSIAGKRSAQNNPMEFRADALIFRDALLSDGYDWKKLLVEIQEQPSEFELLPLVTGYFQCLSQLCLEAMKLQNERLSECARYFDTVRRLVKIPTGAVPVIFVGESTSKETPPLQFEVIPMEQFEYLLREYEQLIRTKESEQH